MTSFYLYTSIEMVKKKSEISRGYEPNFKTCLKHTVFRTVSNELGNNVVETFT